MEILVDTREKKPFKFLFSKGSIVTEQCLKTGDYSLRGHEDKITIDRKATSGELAMCFGSEWKRFQKELYHGAVECALDDCPQRWGWFFAGVSEER